MQKEGNPNGEKPENESICYSDIGFMIASYKEIDKKMHDIVHFYCSDNQ